MAGAGPTPLPCPSPSGHPRCGGSAVESRHGGSSYAITYERMPAARLGRRLLPPRLRSARGDGPRCPRPARARRRRAGARRRVRHRPRDRRAARAAARPARWSRSTARRRWSSAHAPCCRAAVELRVADLLELEVDRSGRRRPLDRDVPLDRSITTACSRACTRRCVPGGRLVAQCGGEGNVAAASAAVRAVGAREPYAAALAGWAGPVALRVARGDRGAAARDGLRGGLVLAPARPRRSRGPARVPRDGRARLPPRAPAEPSCARRSSADVHAAMGVDHIDYVRLNILARRPGGEAV